MSAGEVIIGCHCGGEIRTEVALNQVGDVTCPGCEFIWSVSRKQTTKGIERKIRMKRSGKHALNFKRGDEMLQIEPYTSF